MISGQGSGVATAVQPVLVRVDLEQVAGDLQYLVDNTFELRSLYPRPSKPTSAPGPYSVQTSPVSGVT